MPVTDKNFFGLFFICICRQAMSVIWHRLKNKGSGNSFKSTMANALKFPNSTKCTLCFNFSLRVTNILQTESHSKLIKDNLSDCLVIWSMGIPFGTWPLLNLPIFIMKKNWGGKWLNTVFMPHFIHTGSFNMSIEDTHLKVIRSVTKGGKYFQLQWAEATSSFECFSKTQTHTPF